VYPAVGSVVSGALRPFFQHFDQVVSQASSWATKPVISTSTVTVLVSVSSKPLVSSRDPTVPKLGFIGISAGHEPVEEKDLPAAHRGLWCRLGVGAVSLGQPEDPPRDDAEQRQDLHDPLGRPEAGLLRSAAGFEDLVKGLNLPPNRVPTDLLDRLLAHANGQIGQELPLDRLAAPQWNARGHMEHHEVERRIAPSFSDRRQEVDPTGPDLEDGVDHPALRIGQLDMMQAAHSCFCHLGRVGGVPTARSPELYALRGPCPALGGAGRQDDLALSQTAQAGRRHRGAVPPL
jgi:hypothetical protein